MKDFSDGDRADVERSFYANSDPSGRWQIRSLGNRIDRVLSVLSALCVR